MTLFFLEEELFESPVAGRQVFCRITIAAIPEITFQELDSCLIIFPGADYFRDKGHDPRRKPVRQLQIKLPVNRFALSDQPAWLRFGGIDHASFGGPGKLEDTILCPRYALPGKSDRTIECYQNTGDGRFGIDDLCDRMPGEFCLFGRDPARAYPFVSVCPVEYGSAPVEI